MQIDEVVLYLQRFHPLCLQNHRCNILGATFTEFIDLLISARSRPYLKSQIYIELQF